MEAVIGTFWPHLLVLGAAIAGLWRVWAAGRKAGINQERARHVERREADLDRIRRAADAKPAGGVQDDPYNRDHR